MDAIPGTNTITATSDGLAGDHPRPCATGAGAATQISLNAGDGQTAIAGSNVATAPSVLVTDARNTPVSGVSVTFAVASGGGSVTLGSATTNINGIATVGSWTLKASDGYKHINSFERWSYGITNNLYSNRYSRPGYPDSHQRRQWSNCHSRQYWVSTAPAVIVMDANNNPVSGVSITFGGGIGRRGSVTGATVLTDATGTATLGTWKLGNTAGTNTLTVTKTGLAGSPVTFTATGVSGTATQMSISAGNSQTAIAGNNVTTAPAVLVRDANNNPVSGVSVTFAVVTGGGSITGGTACNQRKRHCRCR